MIPKTKKLSLNENQLSSYKKSHQPSMALRRLTLSNNFENSGFNQQKQNNMRNSRLKEGWIEVMIDRDDKRLNKIPLDNVKIKVVEHYIKEYFPDYLYEDEIVFDEITGLSIKKVTSNISNIFETEKSSKLSKVLFNEEKIIEKIILLKPKNNLIYDDAKINKINIILDKQEEIISNLNFKEKNKLILYDMKTIKRQNLNQKISSERKNVLLCLIKIRKKKEDKIIRVFLVEWNKRVRKEKEKLNKYIEKLQKSQCFRFFYLLKRLSDQINLQNEYNIYQANLKDKNKQKLQNLFTLAYKYKIHILPYFLPVKVRLKLIDFFYQLSETIKKNSQEFALIKILNHHNKYIQQHKNNFKQSEFIKYINLTQIDENEFSRKNFSHYFYTLKNFLEIRKSDIFENCLVKKHLEEKFSSVRNIYSYKWWSIKERKEFQIELAETDLIRNKYDENLVDFIFLYIFHVNKIKASKKFIIARLKKLRNLNNTNIFFLIKLQEFIYLQTLKIKVDLCSDCYCDETKINNSEEDACKCDCHLGELNDIDEEVRLPVARCSMKNEVLLKRNRENEKLKIFKNLENFKKFNLRYKITKIQDKEITDEVDVLDAINLTALRTSLGCKMVNFAYSKLNLPEKKKFEAKVFTRTEADDSKKYRRIKYTEDDSLYEMNSDNNILLSRSKANFNFSHNKFQKSETPKERLLVPLFTEANNIIRRGVENNLNLKTTPTYLKWKDYFELVPLFTEANNIIRKSVESNLNLKTSPSNLKWRDYNEDDEYKMNSNYIRKSSKKVFLQN